MFVRRRNPFHSTPSVQPVYRDRWPRHEAGEDRPLPESNRFPPSSMCFTVHRASSSTQRANKGREGGGGGKTKRRDRIPILRKKKRATRRRRRREIVGRFVRERSTWPITCSTRFSRGVTKDASGRYGVAAHTWQPAAGQFGSRQYHPGRLTFDRREGLAPHINHSR